MKAEIEVEIKKILRMKVDEKLLKKIPRLRETTEKTIKELCEHIDKYFKEKKIITKSKLIKLK